MILLFLGLRSGDRPTIIDRRDGFEEAFDISTVLKRIPENSFFAFLMACSQFFIFDLEAARFAQRRTIG